MITIKRVYEPASKADGFRILVDRLWPRGLTKERAKVDLWLKEVAPSDALRKWFGHDADKWKQFEKKYLAELKGKKQLLRELKRSEREHGTVTLLYGRNDPVQNQAVILLRVLKGKK